MAISRAIVLIGHRREPPDIPDTYLLRMPDRDLKGDLRLARLRIGTITHARLIEQPVSVPRVGRHLVEPSRSPPEFPCVIGISPLLRVVRLEGHLHTIALPDTPRIVPGIGIRRIHIVRLLGQEIDPLVVIQHLEPEPLGHLRIPGIYGIYRPAPVVLPEIRVDPGDLFPGPIVRISVHRIRRSPIGKRRIAPPAGEPVRIVLCLYLAYIVHRDDIHVEILPHIRYRPPRTEPLTAVSIRPVLRYQRHRSHRSPVQRLHLRGGRSHSAAIVHMRPEPHRIPPRGVDRIHVGPPYLRPGGIRQTKRLTPEITARGHCYTRQCAAIEPLRGTHQGVRSRRRPEGIRPVLPHRGPIPSFSRIEQLHRGPGDRVAVIRIRHRTRHRAQLGQACLWRQQKISELLGKLPMPVMIIRHHPVGIVLSRIPRIVEVREVQIQPDDLAGRHNVRGTAVRSRRMKVVPRRDRHLIPDDIPIEAEAHAPVGRLEGPC